MAGLLFSPLFQTGTSPVPQTIPGGVEELDTSSFPIEFANRLHRLAGNRTHLVLPASDGGPYFTGNGFFVSLRNGASPVGIQPNQDARYQTMGVDANGSLTIISYNPNTNSFEFYRLDAGTVVATALINAATANLGADTVNEYLFDPFDGRYLVFGSDAPATLRMRLLHSPNSDMFGYTGLTLSDTAVGAPQQVVAFKGNIVGYRGGNIETFNRDTGYSRTTRLFSPAAGNFGRCICARPDSLAAWQRTEVIARSLDGITWTAAAATVDTSWPLDDVGEYFPMGFYDYMRRGDRVYRAPAGSNAFTELPGAWTAGAQGWALAPNFPGIAAASRGATAGSRRFLNYLR